MIESLKDLGVEFVGARPLKNGRIALSYRNIQTRDEEVRVYNVWEDFKDRRYDPEIDHLFDPEFFSTMFYYAGCVCWTFQMEFPLEDLYTWSDLVEEDFYCLV